jgi:hypothetical protein
MSTLNPERLAELRHALTAALEAIDRAFGQTDSETDSGGPGAASAPSEGPTPTRRPKTRILGRLGVTGGHINSAWKTTSSASRTASTP